VREILLETYGEVASGNEIRSVVVYSDRLKDFDGTVTWEIGEKVRAAHKDEATPLRS
jgi:ketol-acid reductoisomerase